MALRASSKKKNRRGPAVVQIVVAVAIVAIVVTSFGLNLAGPGEQSGIPQSLGSLELIGTVEGPEATSRVDGLHGIGMELSDAYIVEYVRGKERGTVWVGETATSAAAAELVDRMVRAIEGGGSGFGNVRGVPTAGEGVFQLDGPGGDHFFYQSRRTGREVIWLTVSAADPLSILEAALDDF